MLCFLNKLNRKAICNHFLQIVQKMQNLPSFDSQVSSSTDFVGGGTSFLQQTWLPDGHTAVSALIKRPCVVMPEFSLPFNLSKHWPFSTHRKPSFLNSGSEHSRMTFISLQHSPLSGHMPCSAWASISWISSLTVSLFFWQLSLATHLTP